MTDAAAGAAKILASNPASARVTPELIGEMLTGFTLIPLKDLAWFSNPIKVLAYIVSTTRLPKGNAEIRDGLLDVAERARDLFRDVRILSNDAHDELFRYIRELEALPEDIEAERTLGALYGSERLLWLAKSFEALAERFDEKPQSPKWRAKTRQNWRVWIAVELTDLFEQGFGKSATLIKWPSQTENASLGPWADFYQRVMGTIFGEKATPNLEGVLAEARKQIRRGDIRSPRNF